MPGGFKIWILPPKSKIAFPLSGKKLCSANIFSLALRSANKFVSATRRRRRPRGNERGARQPAGSQIFGRHKSGVQASSSQLWTCSPLTKNVRNNTDQKAKCAVKNCELHCPEKFFYFLNFSPEPQTAYPLNGKNARRV